MTITLRATRMSSKSKYIESLKGFGERRKPRVEQGFAGKRP
jgi:hypothetical protein